MQQQTTSHQPTHSHQASFSDAQTNSNTAQIATPSSPPLQGEGWVGMVLSHPVNANESFADLQAADHQLPPILRRHINKTQGPISPTTHTEFRRRRTDHPSWQAQQQRGFTLIELMFAVAIVAVLCAVSVPSLGNIAASTRARSGNNTLITALNLARNTSIAHQHEIVLCPSKAGQGCEDTTWWQHGWIAFADLNRDGKRNDNEPILTRAQEQEGIAIATSTARDHVTYRPNGSASGTNLTFTFCDRRGAKYASTVVVSNPGRPRTGVATPAQAAAACAGL